MFRVQTRMCVRLDWLTGLAFLLPWLHSPLTVYCAVIQHLTCYFFTLPREFWTSHSFTSGEFLSQLPSELPAAAYSTAKMFW
jgi:hypothetical protein